MKNGGELVQSIQEQITAIEANIDTFLDDDIKELLESQKRDLKEMLRLATQYDL